MLIWKQLVKHPLSGKNMVRLIQLIYTGYFALIFVITFLLLYIPFFLIAQVKAWHKYVSVLNKLWSYFVFPLTFLPFKIYYERPLDTTTNYIFCPNHFSYFDIPSLARTPTYVQFVGMSELEKIPLFGYLFRKLHLPVDRKSVQSRIRTFKKSMLALKEGRSLIFFPEGGIKTNHPPALADFKIGAFKLAVATGVEVVPVTLRYNWLFLPDDGKFLMRRTKIEVVYHSPISPLGWTAEALREKVFNVINEELNKSTPQG